MNTMNEIYTQTTQNIPIVNWIGDLANQMNIGSSYTWEYTTESANNLSCPEDETVNGIKDVLRSELQCFIKEYVKEYIDSLINDERLRNSFDAIINGDKS